MLGQERLSVNGCCGTRTLSDSQVLAALLRRTSLNTPPVFIAAAAPAGGQEYIQGTADGWRERTIYQVVTDRFDAPKLQYAEGGEPTPCNVTRLNYCGGTFASVEGHLDYIMGMNFGAVWISPTVVNAPGGYHGYWCAPLRVLHVPHQGFVLGAHTSLTW